MTSLLGSIATPLQNCLTSFEMLELISAIQFIFFIGVHNFNYFLDMLFSWSMHF